MRRKAYGVLLAFFWAICLGSGWEAIQSERYRFFGVLVPVSMVLIWATMIYTRWARTGRFPRAVAQVLELLPEDDAPMKVRILSSLTPPAPGGTASERGEESLIVQDR